MLEKINYNPSRDHLWFVGDLVNRGPDSLQVLRFLKNVPNLRMVLGNHDLYLLILGYGLVPSDRYPHTLHAIMAATDRLELLDWLRHQPLLHFDGGKQAVMVHAGIAPQWTVAQSVNYAAEVEQVLQGAHFKAYLKNLFGDQPASWREALVSQDRWRYITNVFTRMRVCQADGTLEFDCQDPCKIDKLNYRPWFEWRKPEPVDIFFGHWAMLDGKCSVSRCYALDTGCVWGKFLTAICLENKRLFSIPYNILKKYG